MTVIDILEQHERGELATSRAHTALVTRFAISPWGARGLLAGGTAAIDQMEVKEATFTRLIRAV